MSKFWGKRPSPSLVISLLALFVALGGSAYAASKIGTKNIKNNAITSAKIKKNAVTTVKIRNGAVTGAKIRAATLGTVPSATNATNATHAATADSATHAATADSARSAVNATNFSRYFNTGLKKASVGETISLLTISPFTFVGKCVDEGSGTIEAGIYATTSQAGANVYSLENGGYSENDFEPGDEQEVDYGASSTETEVAFWSSGYNSFSAESGDGATLIEGSGNSAVRAFGADCAFQLVGFNNS